MLELGSSGSVRGVSSNGHPYRDPGPKAVGRCHARGFFIALRWMAGFQPRLAICQSSPSRWKSQPNSIQFQNSQRSLARMISSG